MSTKNEQTSITELKKDTEYLIKGLDALTREVKDYPNKFVAMAIYETNKEIQTKLNENFITKSEAEAIKQDIANTKRLTWFILTAQVGMVGSIIYQLFFK